MPPLLHPERDTESRELMDSPDCDIDALNNTYRQFEVINSLISRWKKIYKTKLKPLFDDPDKTYSLLDIGFGGGDIPLKLARWAAEDDVKLTITAIETDPRAYRFATAQDAVPDNVTFHLTSSTELLEKGRSFDVVISNHLVHHLNREGLNFLLSEAEQLSRKAVFFNDIERSDIGYILFNIFARPVFRSSFITHDGLTSIQRSYTSDELQQVVPSGWTVERLFPFRLLLSYYHE